jgi:hypothetical protein
MIARMSVCCLVLLAAATRDTRAEECREPKGPPAAGHAYFFFRLVTAEPKSSAVPMDRTTRAFLTNQPPNGDFNPAEPVKNCFASSVAANSRAIQARAKAIGFNPQLCPQVEGWSKHTRKNPFECRMTRNKKGAVADGSTRLVDLNKTQRAYVLNDIMEGVAELPANERAPALREMAAAFDVREGVLAKSFMIKTLPKCTSKCIDNLPRTLDVPVRDYLTASKNAIAEEEKRVAKANTVRLEAHGNVFAQDIVLILDDPSQAVAFGTDAASKQRVIEYVNKRLTPDQAKRLAKFVEADFDTRVAFRPTPKARLDHPKQKGP